MDIADAPLSVIHLGAFVHQLQLVPVTGNDDNLHVLGRCLSKGANNIVGLVIIQFQRVNAQRIQHLHGQGKLLAKLAGSGLALPLVVSVHFRAEGFAGFVKGHCHITGLQIAQKLEQHVAQAVYGASVHALLVHQGRQCEKGSVD